MSKIFKYSMALLAVALGFVACSDDDDDNYQPATITGSQVFFDKSLATTVNLTQTTTSFSIPLSRYVDTEALTVGIAKVDEEGAFTVPSSVQFAAGEQKADIVVAVNPDDFEYNKAKSLVLTFDKDASTPYGLDSIALTVVKPMTYKSLGKGTWVDNWFGFDAEVEIFQCEQNTNLFRIPKPYTAFPGDEDLEMQLDKAGDYLELTVLQPGDDLNGVTITKSDLVYFPVYNTGAYFGEYDDYLCLIHPATFSSLRAEENFLHSYVVEYQADGTPAQIQLAPYVYMMDNGGWNYTQRDGFFEIYFPGNKPLDYDVAVAYEGKVVSPADEYFAQFSVTVGADLDEVKYVLAAGDDTNAILGGVLGGSIEAESLTADATLSIPVEKAGTYTFVAVGYAEGEAQSYDYATILFEMGGGETWTAVAPGIYTYGVAPLTQDAESAYEGRQQAVLYQSSLDESRYRIMPWAGWASDGLIFTWNKETNVLKANGADTGENYIEDGEDYGRILFYDLVSLDEDNADYPSTYKPDTKTFQFLGAYVFGQYWFGAVVETFQLIDVDEATEAAARQKGSAVRTAGPAKQLKKQALRRMHAPERASF